MKNTTPQQHDESLDLNGNPVPVPIRILRATAFGTIGVLLVLVTPIGADTTLQKMETTFGACGAVIAFVLMRLTQWRESSSPTNRLALFLFFGSIVGAVIAAVLFGGWSLSDSIAAGLGSGVGLGIMNSLGGIALRSALLSFSK
jgi:hypothetical protein